MSLGLRSFVRRLPVYLLLDCSQSMGGSPIIAVNEGLGMIYRELMGDALIVSTVHISVICFASRADQYSLVPIYQFVPPHLEAEGVTAMASAFQILVESIEHDLIPNVPSQNQHGDYRPLVFLLTDGVPTDVNGYPSKNYQAELQKIKALRGNFKPTIVALGCGPTVDAAMLHEATDNVYLLQHITREALISFFQCMTDSIKMATATYAGGGGDDVSMVIATPMLDAGIVRHSYW